MYWLHMYYFLYFHIYFFILYQKADRLQHYWRLLAPTLLIFGASFIGQEAYLILQLFFYFLKNKNFSVEKILYAVCLRNDRTRRRVSYGGNRNCHIQRFFQNF